MGTGDFTLGKNPSQFVPPNNFCSYLVDSLVTQKSFVVVGAGLGGLATALRLAHRGHKVTVLEKTDQIGGRNREVKVGSSCFDAGPTLLMMMDPFRQLFRDVGERIEDHLELSLCDPSYRVFYADGSKIEGTTNMARMVRQIEELAGREEALVYPKLIGDLGSLYASAIPNFVRKNFYSPVDFFTPNALRLVAKHKMLGNLADGIAKYVQDPRLQMLFSFQTMYLGMSPYQAPWVYAVLTYMEYGEGIWYAKGGVVEVCRAVARLAQGKGVEIRLNSAVSKIEGKTAFLTNGEEVSGDAVICNADLPYARRELTNRPTPKKNERYSCSAFMTYMDYEGQIPEILHHNVFFGSDFATNLNDIFNEHRLPEDPAFYACVSAKTDPGRSVPGHENLYVLVPCPNLDYPWSDDAAKTLQTKVFDRLTKETSFKRENIREMKMYTPKDWSDDLNLDRGAAFGLSHDFWQSAYFRPQNRSTDNPNLYFVGASTVPGNGLPMVLISAELIEDRLVHDGLMT